MDIVDAPSLFGLEGRVAVVTGASSGLGVTFAQGLASAGADIVLAARSEDALADTRRSIESMGRRAFAHPTDVTDPDQCTRLVEAALDHFGRVDILVNNAGLATAFPATREKPEDFLRVMDTNLNGAYWMAQSCGRVMQPGSSIINITSIVGYTTIGIPQAAYASSKAALVGLTRDLAVQWSGRKGIRVNGLAPGFIELGMNDESTTGPQEHRIALGRKGGASDLVGPIVFLASPASCYVTGTVLVVDGGVLTS
jgi:NAD(P)-dependent dehydrogenase (short-subunit alcohol dehydrogenase family)